MPVSRTRRAAKERTVKIDVGAGEDLTIVVDARRITPAWIGRLSEREAADDALAVSRALAEIMVSWDMVEEDGSPTPLSVEYLADSLDMEELSLLMQKLIEATTPASEEGNVSGSTSSTPSTDSTSSPETPQNGPQPSPLPKPSESLPSR